MGLAEALLGKSNPFSQWVGENQNFLSAIGAGLGQGQNLQSGLGAGLSMLPQAKQLDRAAAEKQKADQLAETQLNATTSWLQANQPDLADAVKAGMPVSQAWQEAMQRMQPQAAPSPMEINGQLVNPSTGEVIGDYRTPETVAPPAPPSGYQTNPDGSLSFIRGGPADPAIKDANKPPTEAQQRAASLTHVVEPELKVVEDNWEQLKDGGNQSAAGVDIAGWKPLQGYTSPGFQQAQNSLKTIISSYLYAISGATANPGEVQNNVDILTPKFGESQASQNAKKDRVRQMVEAIQMQAKGGLPQGAGGSNDDIDAILTGLGV